MSTISNDSNVEITDSSDFDGGSIASTIILTGDKDVLDQIREGEGAIIPQLEAAHNHAIGAHLKEALEYTLEQAQFNPNNKGTGLPQEYDESVEHLTVGGITFTMNVHVTLENGLDSDTVCSIIAEVAFPVLVEDYIANMARAKRRVADKDNFHARGVHKFVACPSTGDFPGIAIIQMSSRGISFGDIGVPFAL